MQGPVIVTNQLILVIGCRHHVCMLPAVGFDALAWQKPLKKKLKPLKKKLLKLGAFGAVGLAGGGGIGGLGGFAGPQIVRALPAIPNPFG